MNPAISYIICALPRSGSSLLCIGLRKTKVAGNPWEYFHARTIQQGLKSWGITTREEYLDKVVEEECTPNGVFGVKIFWSEFSKLGGLLTTRLPDSRYILLTRRDKIRQAISFDKALQTNVWAQGRDEDLPTHERLRFDFHRIRQLHHRIVAHELAWTRYFARHGVTPLDICYEDFTDSLDETLRRIVSYLGVEFPDDHRVGPGKMVKMSDEISEEWVERYREMAQG